MRLYHPRTSLRLPSRPDFTRWSNKSLTVLIISRRVTGRPSLSTPSPVGVLSLLTLYDKSLSLTLPVSSVTLELPDVSGLASDNAALSLVACGGRSDCRVLSSFLISGLTCITLVTRVSPSLGLSVFFASIPPSPRPVL